MPNYPILCTTNTISENMDILMNVYNPSLELPIKVVLIIGNLLHSIQELILVIQDIYELVLGYYNKQYLSSNDPMSRNYVNVDIQFTTKFNIHFLPNTRPLSPCDYIQSVSILYKGVAVGGTFDHLHSAHRLLLCIATLTTSKYLIVGITTEPLLLNKKYRTLIQPFDERAEVVARFVKSIRHDVNLTIKPIDEPSGGITNNPNIEALVCSEETVNSAENINKSRINIGLMPLKLLVLPILLIGATKPTVLSSTLIRSELNS